MNDFAVSIENGKWILKKFIKSNDELIFYNSDYFKRIGFPDAEIIIGANDSRKMYGGKYSKPDELTYPFRQFVFLTQGQDNNNNNNNNNVVEELPDKLPDNKPNFFERLNSYGIQMKSYVKSGIDRVTPYLNANNVGDNSKNMEELNKKPETEPLVKETEPLVKESEPKNYFKVTIPITESLKTEQIGKYEKEEEKLNQILREEKIDRSLGKSKDGKMCEVGNRYMRMCEEVKEWKRYEIDESPLIGSKMSKYKKMRTKAFP
jgi:hypothetical protein